MAMPDGVISGGCWDPVQVEGEVDLAGAVSAGLRDRHAVWAFVRAFVACWLRPLQPGDGLDDVELAEVRDRLQIRFPSIRSLPAALEDTYALLGHRHDLTSNQDRLLTGEQLALDETGHVLVVRVENQGCAEWGIRISDLDQDSSGRLDLGGHAGAGQDTTPAPGAAASRRQRSRRDDPAAAVLARSSFEGRAGRGISVRMLMSRQSGTAVVRSPVASPRPETVRQEPGRSTDRARSSSSVDSLVTTPAYAPWVRSVTGGDSSRRTDVDNPSGDHVNDRTPSAWSDVRQPP
jgi:hypothetical protein